MNVAIRCGGGHVENKTALICNSWSGCDVSIWYMCHCSTDVYCVY